MISESPSHLSAGYSNKIKTALLCFIAISPSLGTAVAALGRLLLYLWGLGALLASLRGKEKSKAWPVNKPITGIILIACFFYALSTLWSLVDLSEAWLAWSSYARLITIPLMYYLIKNSTQGFLVLRAFTFTQVFACLSSWLLVFGFHPPWISAVAPAETFTAYGTYIEQSVCQAAMVGILWFKRDSILGPKGKPIAFVIIIASILLVFVYLPGRTGHLAMLGVIALACIHAVPNKLRPLALLAPLFAAAALLLFSPNIQQRSVSVQQELASFYNSNNISTSVGTRLHFWAISTKGIIENPVIGVGAGSWKIEYRRQVETGSHSGAVSIANADNPHQEFFIWGVEGGLIGLGLLFAVLLAVYKQSGHLQDSDAWALRAMLLVLTISCLFNSILHGIGIGDFFCVGIGIILSLSVGKCSPVNLPKEK
jgi:O-antigen ligase